MKNFESGEIKETGNATYDDFIKRMHDAMFELTLVCGMRDNSEDPETVDIGFCAVCPFNGYCEVILDACDITPNDYDFADMGFNPNFEVK